MDNAFPNQRVNIPFVNVQASGFKKLLSLDELTEKLFENIPSGVGSKGKIRLKENEINDVLDYGAEWAVDNGYGWAEDLEVLEENGKMEDADSSIVSDKAKKRGIPQLGSLGSGNHFLEIQIVDEIIEDRKSVV